MLFMIHECARVGLLMIFIYFFYMQSTHMASPQITEEAVYLCTGNPLPKDIEQISYWLLNESFAESFTRIHPECFQLYSFYKSSLEIYLVHICLFCD